MSLKKNLKSKKAQSVLEYTVLFAVMLAGIIASGFLTRVAGIFSNHFNEAVRWIVGG